MVYVLVEFHKNYKLDLKYHHHLPSLFLATKRCLTSWLIDLGGCYLATISKHNSSIRSIAEIQLYRQLDGSLIKIYVRT